MVRVAQPMPAQLTRDLSGPISVAASTAAITCSVLVTSVCAKSPPISLARISPLSAWRSATTPRTPGWARSREVASPSPEAPPVTTADVPFRSIVLSDSFATSSKFEPVPRCPVTTVVTPRPGEDRSRAGARSHLLGRLHAQPAQALFEHPRGEVAQAEPRGAQRVVVDEDTARLVERGERRRQLVEVGAQLGGAQGLGRPLDRLGEAQQLQRQRALGPLAEDRHRARSGRIDLASPEERADAGVRVLQVGAGVALGREHAVPVEDVVTDA